jgi:hypothetical protein
VIGHAIPRLPTSEARTIARAQRGNPNCLTDGMDSPEAASFSAAGSRTNSAFYGKSCPRVRTRRALESLQLWSVLLEDQAAIGAAKSE